MDTFKIIVIIFMMIVIYQIYQLNCSVYKDNREGFADTPVQSVGGVDDTNAINTLAQIAKNLMAGGVTVPGNMTVAGNMTINGVLNPAVGVWHTSTDGKARIHYGNNSHSYYRTNDAHVWRNSADQDKMILYNDGVLTVQGRNILAELDKLNSRWKGDDLVVNSINASGNLNGPNYSIDTSGLIKVNKMKFGKFLISGNGDYAANDTTIRPVFWDNQSRMADFASNTLWRAAKPDHTFS